MPRSVTTLALLIALSTNLALGAEIHITKPPAICPETDLGDAEFQTHYDEMWQMFTSAVAETSDEIKRALEALKDEAQNAGNLDLALHWMEQLESFQKTNGLKWETGGQNKKTWKDRFGETPFPDDLSATLGDGRKAYSEASDCLNVSYEDLVKKLTMAGLLDKAKQVKSEWEAVMAGKVVRPNPRNTPPVSTDDTKPDNDLQLLAHSMIGVWANPVHSELRILDADGTFRAVALSGEERFPRTKVATEKGWAKCVSPAGDWFEMWLLDDHQMAFVYRTADGKTVGGGGVWYRTGRIAIEGRPETSRPIAPWLVGEWVAPDINHIYVIQDDGILHEVDKVTHEDHATGRLVSITEQIAEFVMSNKYRLRFRSSDKADSVALMKWEPGGKPLGAGSVLERAK